MTQNLVNSDKVKNGTVVTSATEGKSLAQKVYPNAELVPVCAFGIAYAIWDGNNGGIAELRYKYYTTQFNYDYEFYWR